MITFSKFIKYFVCCCIPKFKLYKWDSSLYEDVENLAIKDEYLINCNIASSHNSILGKLQICTRVGIYPLLKSINKNFRQIELDVFYKNNKFVVGHGKSNECIATNTIDLIECFDIINEYGWKDTNLPLFISLEVNTNNTKDLEVLIRSYFTNRLYDSKTKQLQNCTIRELRDKLIILSGKHLNFEPLYKLSNYPQITKFDNTDNLVRIYPTNILLSKNYDFYQFLKKSNFISINTCYKDKYYYQYIGYFKKCGIRKK